MATKSIMTVKQAKYSSHARRYLESSFAANTIKAYRSDWNDFEAWCQMKGVCPLPASPETVIEYISFLANDLKVNTISRRLTTIAIFHRAAMLDNPVTKEDVRLVMQGIRRIKGTLQTSKNALLFKDLDQIKNIWGNDLASLRNKAIVLLGFAGAFRRSELVSLNVEDLEFAEEGIKVLLRWSKTDQDKRGAYKGINRFKNNPDKCPVKAVKDWLEASKIISGPLFRPITRNGKIRPARLTDKSVALIIKDYVKRIGKDPKKYSGHSLRRGLITSAALAGANEREIMKQSGHKSLTMVRRYIEDDKIFVRNGLDMLDRM